MIKNHASDKKQYERYRSVMGKKAGKTFEEFQEMKYNDPEKWEEVKTQYKETRVKEKEK